MNMSVLASLKAVLRPSGEGRTTASSKEQAPGGASFSDLFAAGTATPGKPVADGATAQAGGEAAKAGGPEQALPDAIVEAEAEVSGDAAVAADVDAASVAAGGKGNAARAAILRRITGEKAKLPEGERTEPVDAEAVEAEGESPKTDKSDEGGAKGGKAFGRPGEQASDAGSQASVSVQQQAASAAAVLPGPVPEPALRAAATPALPAFAPAASMPVVEAGTPSSVPADVAAAVSAVQTAVAEPAGAVPDSPSPVPFATTTMSAATTEASSAASAPPAVTMSAGRAPQVIFQTPSSRAEGAQTAPAPAAMPLPSATPASGGTSAPTVAISPAATTAAAATATAEQEGLPLPTVTASRATSARQGIPLTSVAGAGTGTSQTASMDSASRPVQPGEATALLRLASDEGRDERMGASIARNGEAPVPFVQAGQSTFMAPSGNAAATTAAPVDLSASLGQQVIDMSSGGQWIDSLAKEIATLSAGTGQGSFRLSPEHLGPLRVDIRRDDTGMQVQMTVETQAAEAALSRDSDSLKNDARLSALHISDVKIERAPRLVDAPRNDAAGTGNGQHSAPWSQGSSGQGMQAGTGQGQASGQGAQAQTNGQATSGQSSGGQQNAGKFSGQHAVIRNNGTSDQSTDDGSGDVRRARYA